MHFRRDQREADLLVWESGEAELAIAGIDGNVVQEHFEDLNDSELLSVVLRRLLHVVNPM